MSDLSGELADDQPIKASDAVTKRFVRIKTGTYEGDGEESHAITGVGFEPKVVWVFEHVTAESNINLYLKTDQFDTEYALRMLSTSGGSTSNFRLLDNRLISLDSDGFTVDDDGSDQHPNKDGQAYDYIAFG